MTMWIEFFGGCMVNDLRSVAVVDEVAEVVAQMSSVTDLDPP